MKNLEISFAGIVDLAYYDNTLRFTPNADQVLLGNIANDYEAVAALHVTHENPDTARYYRDLFSSRALSLQEDHLQELFTERPHGIGFTALAGCSVLLEKHSRYFRPLVNPDHFLTVRLPRNNPSQPTNHEVGRGIGGLFRRAW